MNKNQFDFQKIDFTHEQINGMLKLLYKAYLDDENPTRDLELSFLTIEQLNILLEKGFENLSTFDGDYNKLNNLPDIFEIIAESMDDLDIETKAHVNELIATISREYNLIAEQIVNGLREEISRLDIELCELIEDARIELKDNIDSNHEEVNGRITNINNELSERITEVYNELKQTINDVDSTLQKSIIELDNILSEAIGKNQAAIEDNANGIIDLLISVEELQAADESINTQLGELKDRVDVLEVSGGSGTGGAGMTQQEKDQFIEMINSKFDRVEAGKVLDAENNELTELRFYSGDTLLNSVSFAGGSGGGGSTTGGTLTTSMDAYSSISEKDPVIVPYSFTSPNYGTATLYVTVVNGASSKDIEYQVKKQGAGSVNLGILTKGINVISMYVVDAFSKMTNIVEITVVVGALEISSTFDDGKDFESYNTINIPINVSPIDATETMMASITIDDKVFEQQVYDGFNNFAIPEEVKTAGVHKIVIQVSSEKFTSNKLEYNVVIILYRL